VSLLTEDTVYKTFLTSFSDDFLWIVPYIGT